MDAEKSLQAQAQFDWLQERLKDPNFQGISLSNRGVWGDFIPVSTLRAIKSGEELIRLFQPDAYPLKPIEK